METKLLKIAPVNELSSTSGKFLNFFIVSVYNTGGIEERKIRQTWFNKFGEVLPYTDLRKVKGWLASNRLVIG